MPSQINNDHSEFMWSFCRLGPPLPKIFSFFDMRHSSNRIFYLILIFFVAVSQSVKGEVSGRLIVGGVASISGIDFGEGSVVSTQIAVSYESDWLKNIIGKSLVVEYYLGDFGVGVRGNRYSLSGEASLVKEDLRLDLFFLTASYALFDDLFFIADNKSQIAITLGAGQNQFDLTTFTRATANDMWGASGSVYSAGAANLVEISFTSTNQSGWGYRLAVHQIASSHAETINGKTVDPFIEFGTSFMLIKRFF